MESVTENQVPMEDKLAARFAELEEKMKIALSRISEKLSL